VSAQSSWRRKVAPGTGPSKVWPCSIIWEDEYLLLLGVLIVSSSTLWVLRSMALPLMSVSLESEFHQTSCLYCKGCFVLRGWFDSSLTFRRFPSPCSRSKVERSEASWFSDRWCRWLDVAYLLSWLRLMVKRWALSEDRCVFLEQWIFMSRQSSCHWCDWWSERVTLSEDWLDGTPPPWW